MPRKLSLEALQSDYERSAREYLESLPLEHFMESVPQAFQRLIFLVAFELVHARRPEVQSFNELLVQYPHGRPAQRRQVVPDNMVVVHPEPIQAKGSYDVPLQPARPFWVLEYVSKSNKRKGYEDNFVKYEKELKVPYYLLFYHDNQELSLYHLERGRYRSIQPDDRGWHAIPELEVAVALVNGWVRFWFRGELLDMPSEIQAQRDQARQDLDVTRQDLDVTRKDLDVSRQDLDRERRERLRAEEELDRLRQEIALLRGQGGK